MSCCNKCNTNPCCCSTTVLRYNGPDIPELGIKTGDLIEVAIQQITDFITTGGSGAVSELTNNGDGTYTHSDGEVGGVSTTFITGNHSTGPTPHASPQYGDTWYDTTTDLLKFFTNDGSIDVWLVTTPSALPRFKEETIHHTAGTTLAIDPDIHNKRELHFESTGDISLDGNDHLGIDDSTYLIVNTTAVDRSVTFSNVDTAHIRDGGTITDLSGTGFTIPPNSSMLITVSDDGGLIKVDGHFYALEISGDTLYTFEDTFSLIGFTPQVSNISGMDKTYSIEVFDDSGVVITSSLDISVSGEDVTILSNVSLFGTTTLRVIYTI